MMGCHVYSTRPARARGKHATVPLSPAEVCTMALSALQWRKHNGPMRLYADGDFASFVRTMGLEWLYNAGIDTAVLEGMPPSIGYDTFWAAPKIFAYAAVELPAAFVDVDLILWDSIPPWKERDLVFLHHESNGRGDGRDYTRPPGYEFPRYPWDGDEFNMSFVLLNNESLRREYVAEAIRFMSGNPAAEPWKHMCFAEQYMLAQCAKARQSKILAMLDGPPCDERVVTHLWGVKRRFEQNPIRGRAWMARCIARLEAEFPEHREKLCPLIQWAQTTAQSQVERRGIHGEELLRRPPRRFFTPPRHHHHLQEVS